MALDWYLKKFKEIYPTGPKVMDVFCLYEAALGNVSELDLAVACERALRECKYFPTPAEIFALCPKNDFLATSTAYNDLPLTEDDRKIFQDEMALVAKKLNVKPVLPQKVREKYPLPRTWCETNYIAMVGSQTLQEWALGQDLNDSLPRSAQEIECIRTVQNYGKPRKKRRPYREQRGV